MLLEHNYPVYQALEDMLAENNKAILVTATGTGKSYVALEYLERHNLRALVVCPKHVICTAWEKLTDRVDTMTYQKFSKLSKIPEYDCYIFDEAHHAGSRVWGKAVKDFMDTCAAPVIGLTADSKRYSDGGKDVAEELWDDCVVHGYDQAEAVKEGVLPDATYICTLFGIEERIQELEQLAIDPALWARLDYTLKNCGTMEEILKRHMPAGLRKGIIFVDSISETQTAKDFILGVYPGVTAEILHYRMSKQEKAEIVFRFEKGDSGYLIAVDMLNEGLHVGGVNTVIMLRRTSSPTVFTQQLGRCLAPGNKDVVIFDFVGNQSSLKYISIQTEAVAGAARSSQGPKKSKQVIVFDYASPVIAVLNEIRDYLSNRWTPDEDAMLRKYYPEGIAECCAMIPGRSEAAIRCRAAYLGIRLQTHGSSVAWTEEEDRIIQEFYPLEGAKCADRLNNRTKGAVSTRAYTLGINSRPKSPSWTEDEETILRRYYPTEGGACADRIKAHSRSSIRSHACVLGLKFDPPNFWSVEEDAILRKFWPIEGGNCASRFPSKSKKDVQVRAGRLKLRYAGRAQAVKWTPEEDAIILEFFPTEGKKCADRLPGKAPDRVLARARKLGLRRREFVPAWSAEEDDIIRKYYPSEGKSCAVRLPGRTPFAVKTRAKTIGIRNNRTDYWTEEDDRFLIDNYPSHGTAYVAEHLGRSKEAIMSRAKNMGLKSQVFWTKEEDDIIRKFYPIEGKKCADRLESRTLEAVKERAMTLKVREKHAWTREEEETLIKYFPVEGWECAKRLPRRTKSSIQNRLGHLGLIASHVWSDAELDILKKYYPLEGGKCAARLQNRTEKAVCGKAKRMGIKLIAQFQSP